MTQRTSSSLDSLFSLLSLLKTLAWFRTRVLVNTLKSGSKRDMTTRLARVAEVFSPILMGLAIVPPTLSLFAFSVYGGWWISNRFSPPSVDVVQIVLAVATILVLIMPLASAMQGSFATSQRFLLLPVPGGLLHAAQIGSGLSDPVIVALLPAVLLGFPTGFVLGGEAAESIVVGLLGLLFLFLLLSLQSAVALFLQLLFRDRRRAEWLSILFILALSLSGFLPVILGNAESEEEMERQFGSFLEGVISLTPSRLYYDALESLLSLSFAGIWLNMAGLLVLATFFCSVSAWMFRHLMQNPERVSPRRKRSDAQRHVLRLPGLSDGTAAVARVLFLNAIRSPRGRMGLLFSPLIVPLIGLTAFSTGGAQRFAENFPAGTGVFLALMAIAFSLLTFQPILLNLFGSDRAGLSLQFLLPLTERMLVRGKLVGSGILTSIASVLGLIGALFVDRSGSLTTWVAVCPVALSAFLVLGPSAVLVSILLPKGSDLSQWGKHGNPHPLAGFLGTFLILPALGIPVALGAVALVVLKSEQWLMVLLGAWLGLTLIFALAITGLSERVLARRREALVLAASDR